MARGRSEKPIFEDKRTRLYQSSAEEIVRTFGDDEFDLCILDPPRSGPYMGASSEIAQLIIPRVSRWIVVFVGNARQQRAWRRDKVSVHMPLPFLPDWNRDERMLFVPIKNEDPEIPRVAPAIADVGPFAPPEWCPSARHPALYRWLYMMLRPKSVIDPFSGSGNALLAAREMGIPAVGIEKNPVRADRIRERLAAT